MVRFIFPEADEETQKLQRTWIIKLKGAASLAELHFAYGNENNEDKWWKNDALKNYTIARHLERSEKKKTQSTNREPEKI